MSRPAPLSHAASAANAYPSTTRATYVIAVLFVLTITSQLDRQLPALLVGPLRTEFGISDTAFGVLQSYAFALSFTLMGLPLGRLVDSRNRRNLLVAGLLLWSAATALFGLGQSYGALVMARVFLGVGEAVLAPAAFSIIADLVPPHRRGRALAFYSVSIAVGSGASLLLGGWLMSVIPAQGLAIGGLGEFAAWRVAFMAAALPGVPLAVLLLATVREPPRQHDSAPRNEPQAPHAAGAFVRYVREQPATFFPLLAYPAVLAFLGYGALTWAPAVLERSHGLGPANTGVVLGIIVAAAGTLGMLAGGFLSDAWAARSLPAARLRVALAGLAVAAMPAVAWPLVPAADAAFALLFVLVFGISVAQSAVPTSVQAVFPNHLRGQAVGAYLLLSGLFGIGLGPTAVALVTDHVFRADSALPQAVALTAAPAALLGLGLIGAGLAPYARTQARRTI